MKKIVTAALVASLITLPATSHEQDPPPIMSFGEGLCVGLIIGVAVDVCVVVGVNCYKKWKNTPPPEPPPGWIITNTPPSLPPLTNSVTNRVAGTLVASNSVSWYAASYGAMFETTIEARSIGGTWAPVCKVRGWQTPTNLIVRLSTPEGVSICTNWIPGAEPYAIYFPFALNLPPNTLTRTQGEE